MFVELNQYRGYLITDGGEIISLISGTWKTLSTYDNGRGYRIINIGRGTQAKRNRKVHRLVAEAFYGPSHLQVNHIDGVKQNNNLSNLEYVTNKQNAQHAEAMGLCSRTKARGERSGRAKLTDEQVTAIMSFKDTGMFQREVATMFDISERYVGYLWAGTKRKHCNEEQSC